MHVHGIHEHEAMVEHLDWSHNLCKLDTMDVVNRSRHVQDETS
jgi:hypothetical protein